VIDFCVFSQAFCCILFFFRSLFLPLYASIIIICLISIFKILYLVVSQFLISLLVVYGHNCIGVKFWVGIKLDVSVFRGRYEKDLYEFTGDSARIETEIFRHPSPTKRIALFSSLLSSNRDIIIYLYII